MNKITLKTKKKRFKTGDLWGLFFEDINHAADGGLYPEMVRNRSFEFCEIDNKEYTPLTAWSMRGEGEMLVEDKEPLNDKNTHYLVLDTSASVSAVNAGFNAGFSFIEGEKYNFSVFAKSAGAVKIIVSLEDNDGEAYTECEFKISGDWKKYAHQFTAPKTDYCGRLSVTAYGRVCLEMVSLMPDKTFKNHGLRLDIGNMLADMRPKFMRFPGGCLTHDGSLDKNDRDSLYRWVNTVGAVEKRPPRRNNWGYNQTAGLGYYEYFVFCEDIGAKPIPILAGAWNPHAHTGAPLDGLDEYVNEALALIEFANGGADTEWGKKRAEFGHPEPFNLEYIGIGNEEVSGGFFERYPYFHKAIRKKYPEIKIIGTSGPWCDGYDFEYGWSEARKWGTDIVDEHYYMMPDWFIKNIDRYKSYDRKGPKVFVGEYASWSNMYISALAEACYMTELENNADVVSLACYAPMLANADYVNWEPDMIWFDNHRVFGTVNYYVQKMFMANQADEVIETEFLSDVKNIPMPVKAIQGFCGVGTARTGAEYYDVFINGKEQTEIKSGGGDTWIYSDGKFLQTDKEKRLSALYFPEAVRNFTITLKAKKLNGIEGLKILFGGQDSGNYYYWEIGGWNNDVSSVCTMRNGKPATVTVGRPITVETGKEYDIEITAEGNRFICKLDGEILHDYTEVQGEIRPLYYTAGVDGNEVIIKAANYRDEDYTTRIALDKDVKKGRVSELRSDDMNAKNSFEHPKKIVPSEMEIEINSSEFTYTFPSRSVTVIRLKD